MTNMPTYLTIFSISPKSNSNFNEQCQLYLQEKLTDSFRQATAKIGATMGMEVSEGPVNGTLIEEIN